VSLLEKLLIGRMEKDGQTGDDRAISGFATPIACSMLKDTKPEVRTVALNCYGAFLSNDWLVLYKLSEEEDEHGAFQEHVNAILSHCVRPSDNNTDGEANAGIRATACKCIGSVCTQYLFHSIGKQGISLISDEERKTFCRAVCEALSISFRDSNTGVRSMVSPAWY
jgi:hypothetical protein